MPGRRLAQLQAGCCGAVGQTPCPRALRWVISGSSRGDLLLGEPDPAPGSPGPAELGTPVPAASGDFPLVPLRELLSAGACGPQCHAWPLLPWRDSAGITSVSTQGSALAPPGAARPELGRDEGTGCLVTRCRLKGNIPNASSCRQTTPRVIWDALHHTRPGASPESQPTHIPRVLLVP